MATSTESSNPKSPNAENGKGTHFVLFAEKTETPKENPGRKWETRTRDSIRVLDSEELEDYDDGVDFPYDEPPLICCFGTARGEFVPTVRVSDNPMDPDFYSQWKMLLWDSPEFARAPMGSPSDVAISHVQLGGRATFVGKVGDDDFGDELVLCEG